MANPLRTVLINIPNNDETIKKYTNKSIIYLCDCITHLTTRCPHYSTTQQLVLISYVPSDWTKSKIPNKSMSPTSFQSITLFSNLKHTLNNPKYYS
ncbi:hypothetical protein WN943_018229 [Citrus x changshan-huyou]